MDQLTRLTRSFDDLARFRMANIALIDSVPDEKLMVIPDRFHNNIFWQAGHLLTSQASLLYRRTGQPLPVPESYFGYFGKGSSPDNFDSATPGYSEVRKQLEAILETTRKDLPKMLGLPYEKPITVTSGRILVSFDDALEFSALHEALHTGMITAMLKFL